MPRKIGSRTKKPRVSETVEVAGDRVTVVTEVVEDAAGGETESREVPVKKKEPETHTEEATAAFGGTDDQSDEADVPDTEEAKEEGSPFKAPGCISQEEAGSSVEFRL